MTGMPRITGLDVLFAGGLGVIAVLVFWLVLRRFDGSYEPTHKTSRPWARFAAGTARAARRGVSTLRRAPGARRDLGAYDRETLAVFERMHAEDTGGFTYGPHTPAAAPPRAPDTVPPPVHHDEYAPPQRWHRPPVTRHHLPAPAALVALAAVTGALAAHLQARERAFQAEALAVFPAWEPFTDCLSDDTLARGIPVVK